MKIEKKFTNPFMFWLPVETCYKKSGNSKTSEIWQRGGGGGGGGGVFKKTRFDVEKNQF